ncbi:MAG: glycosyltransferase family 2 protein [Bacteroidales bacterium]|nr:glycosyltransferase family 2 protein [Bacteroidales bacterium]
MLSICIAIHNWDVNRLVNDLLTQADKLNVPYEILLLDDASDYEYQKKNAKLDFLEHVTYLQSYINMGRSLVRNTLASRAKYPYLLFMDCDTTVTHRDFLKKYMDSLPADVLSGGYEYRKRRPRKDCLLRWAYGHAREVKSAQEKNIHPNHNFSTFNFLIKKKIFEKVQFNENLQGYGHEDTLFGLDLLDQGITVYHIDNPLRHDVVCTTQKFLQQIENSIDNLLVIEELEKPSRCLEESVTLLRTYKRMKRWKMVGFYRFFYSLSKKFILKNLYSSKPNMHMLDLYKLGYLCNKTIDL